MGKKILVLLISTLFSGWVHASGAFMPSGGVDVGYNNGKAIVAGRAGGPGCKSCHAKFDRSKIKGLGTAVSEFVADCSKHDPCFNEILSAEQKGFLDAYFKRRYRLR